MNYLFAENTKYYQHSAVREILRFTQQGHVISFAGGLPSEELFPMDAVKAAYEKVFATGKRSLQYGLTAGFLPLREAIQAKMADKGIESSPDTIMCTTGSQQVIDLFARVMLSPGDIVLAENPSYLAALQVFQSYGAKVVAVSNDEDGMDLVELEEKMKKLQPKFIYIVPTFSNPDGKVWSIERRQKLVELCYKYNVLVLEDDPYGDIKFNDDEEYPTVISFDERKSHVLYTSTFSKSVVPALRTGWVTGPVGVIDMISKGKEIADLHSSSLDQQALYFLLRDFDLNGHIQLLRKEYKKRMLIMKDYLNKLDPGLFTHNEPKGGMFMWVKGNEQLNVTNLLSEAVNNGVAYVPGAPFYCENPQYNTFRLNYSHSTPENIKLGMDRLVSVLLKKD